MGVPAAPNIVIPPNTGGKAAVKTYAWLDNKRILAADAKRMYLNLSQQEQQAVIDYANSIGRKPKDAKTVWGQLVDASSAAYAQGIQKTPWQILQEQSQGTQYTTVSKEQYTPDAARAAINATYVKLIGRLANEDEVNQIITAANAQPVTVTQTKYGQGGSKSTVTPDQTPEQIATQQLMSGASYQPERQRMQDLNFASWLDTAMRGGTQAAGSLANG
jgi:hypothetical protein